MLVVSIVRDISQRLLTSRLIDPSAKSPAEKLLADRPEVEVVDSSGSAIAIAVNERLVDERLIVIVRIHRREQGGNKMPGPRFMSSRGRPVSGCERRAHRCCARAPISAQQGLVAWELDRKLLRSTP
jgi:hypothetical protein